MKKISQFAAITLACLIGSSAALASEKGTEAEAVAMVKKAVASVKANGKERAYAEFNNPQGKFVKHDLYVMCYDMSGFNRCHGSNPKLIGKNLIDIKDADGKFVVKGLIAVANQGTGKGWFEYKWPNATTKAVETKATYLEKVDDILIGVGVYK